MPAAWKAFLIDLDGTLYHGNRIIPGANELISGLKAKGLPYLFVTNNSSRTPREVAVHLRAMDIPADEKEVCTSAVAAAEYIAEQKSGCKVAAIGENGLFEALKEAGLTLTLERPEVIVQGIDRTFTYETLARAVRWIREGAAYVLTNPDLLLPTQDGLIPGAGTISASIQAASGVKPVVIGKPSDILVKYAIGRLKLKNDEVAMIGDNLLTDIAAGVHAGCGTILTLTGITTEQNLPDFLTSSGIKPDVVCADLEEVRKLICS